MDSSKGQQNETENLARDLTWSHMTWSQKYSDFYVESKDGLVFKCHKYVLDQNCPYFEALLSYDYKETKESWLKFRDFDGATVGAFLQYLYSHKYDNCAGQQFNRKFSRDKLTSELLVMAHVCQVEDLEEDCIKHLSQNTKIDPMAGDAPDQSRLMSTFNSSEHWTTLLLDLFHSPPKQTSIEQ